MFVTAPLPLIVWGGTSFLFPVLVPSSSAVLNQNQLCLWAPLISSPSASLYDLEDFPCSSFLGKVPLVGPSPITRLRPELARDSKEEESQHSSAYLGKAFPSLDFSSSRLRCLHCTLRS